MSTITDALVAHAREAQELLRADVCLFGPADQGIERRRLLRCYDTALRAIEDRDGVEGLRAFLGLPLQ